MMVTYFRRMDVLAQFRENVADINSVEILRDRFSDAVKTLGYHGFDAFSLLTGTMDNIEQECNSFICDYGYDVPKSYLRDGWLEMDPVASRIAHTTKPFNYVTHLKEAQKNSSVVWQLGVLRLRNVHHAWVIPLSTISHMRGMTVYMRGRDNGEQRRFMETRDEIHLMCVDFLDVFVRLSNKKTEIEEWYSDGFDKSSVSQRETDCLHWAARGKTNREIGVLLGISENTVRYHLKNVYTKLQATSRSSAVSRALSENVIKL